MAEFPQSTLLSLESLVTDLRNQRDSEVIQAIANGALAEIADDFKLLRLIAQLRVQPESLTGENFLEAGHWHYQHPELLWAERAYLALLQNEPTTALSLLQAQPRSTYTGSDYSRLGTAHLLLGDPAAALEAYEQAILLEPDRADHYNNLGGALVRLQRLEEGLAAYEQCLARNPQHPQASQSRLTIASQLGQGEAAIAELEQQLEANPESWQLRLALFHALRRSQRDGEALALITDALQDFRSIDPREPDQIGDDPAFLSQLYYRTALIDLFTGKQQWLKALAVINQCLALFHTPPVPWLLRRAAVLVELQQRDEAAAVVTALAERQDINPDQLLLARADLLSHSDQEQEALALLEQIPPNSSFYKGSLVHRGRLLLQLGRINECHAVLLELAESDPLAFAQLIQTRNYQPNPEVVAKLQTFASNPLLPDGLRETVCFALSEAHAKLKQHTESFQYLQQANNLVDQQVAYKPEQFSRRVDLQIRCFTPHALSSRERLPRSAPKPIFIVGMPRSGTTLTESILGSHPQVHACGELNSIPAITQMIARNFQGLRPYPLCLEQLSRDQLIAMANAYLLELPEAARQAGHSADKLPHNFMNVGLIHLLFPDSPIIHVMRDPRDNGLSNYQQNFGAKYGGMGYSFNLEKIAKQINDYHRMMAHWRAVQIPLFEFWYEDLVANQEALTRQLLEYCGLPWDDQVMAFHTLERSVRTASVGQVRQKIYRSSAQKWRRYEHELQPMIQAFDPIWVRYYPTTAPSSSAPSISA